MTREELAEAQREARRAYVIGYRNGIDAMLERLGKGDTPEEAAAFARCVISLADVQPGAVA